MNDVVEGAKNFDDGNAHRSDTKLNSDCAPTLRERLRSGEVVLGAWSVTGAPIIVDALSAAGIDFVCIDQQHGSVQSCDTATLISAASASTSVLVRVPDLSNERIGKVLDEGADGVVIPLVDSASMAEQMARACRYPPLGNRSFGGRTKGLRRFDGDVVAANEHVLAVAMIETSNAISNIEEICSSSHVDVVYLGMSDLALSLGYYPPSGIPRHVASEILSAVSRACANSHVAWGIQESTVFGRDELIALGATMLSVCNDLRLVDEGVSLAIGR